MANVGITHVKDAVAGVEAFSTLLEGDFNLLITDWDIPNYEWPCYTLLKFVSHTNLISFLFLFIFPTTEELFIKHHYVHS